MVNVVPHAVLPGDGLEIGCDPECQWMATDHRGGRIFGRRQEQ